MALSRVRRAWQLEIEVVFLVDIIFAYAQGNNASEQVKAQKTWTDLGRLLRST